MEKIVLIYDENCPLCCWYTALFVKYGLLPQNGRIPFTEFTTSSTQGNIDLELAQTKIACLNHQTGEVNYGLDSLLLIIGQRFKWIQVMGNFKPIRYLLELLYLFISYNRKIVAPSPKQSMECACEPAKSVLWRSTFIAVVSYLTYLVVQWYFQLYLGNFLVINPVNDLILLIAQIAFQYIVFRLIGQQHAYDYLGHLVFTSFLGALLLLFFGNGISMLAHLGLQTDFLAIVCYGITVACMFFEHKRRVALKGWSLKLCLSWLLFRVCIYPLVFQL